MQVISIKNNDKKDNNKNDNDSKNKMKQHDSQVRIIMRTIRLLTILTNKNANN